MASIQRIPQTLIPYTSSTSSTSEGCKVGALPPTKGCKVGALPPTEGCRVGAPL